MRRIVENGHDPAAAPQGIGVDPQAVIDALLQRVQQLTFENVMLQAELNQRQAEQAVPAPEAS